MILTDNETKVDLLNNEAIATTIIKLLRDKPDQPVTVGVHGDWGAGKSSVLEMIEAGFEGEAKVLCLKFNGWRFQGFEDAKIALIEGIVTGLIEKRPALTKAGEAVKDSSVASIGSKSRKRRAVSRSPRSPASRRPTRSKPSSARWKGFLPIRQSSRPKTMSSAAIDGVKGLLKPASESA